jgi:hypothetical protein
MNNKRKILFQYSMAGALIGYFLFHPMVMLFSYLMTAKHTVPNTINMVGLMAVILQSFSIAMLPWSLSFTLFNGIIGFYYGTFKAEKLAREELIANLQKALADVKTLSGMLPICAWCKKIRNDEGYWQKIEAYMKSQLDLNFTHSICHDCAKKEYPELYPQIKENIDNERE